MQATCKDTAVQEAGPGTCVCRPAYFGTPVYDFDSDSWDNPCSMNAVQIESKLRLKGTSADVVNANRAAFATTVQDGIFAQSGNMVTLIDVIASDVSRRLSGEKRHIRRLQAASVDVAFKVSVVVPCRSRLPSMDPQLALTLARLKPAMPRPRPDLHLRS
jgi:hypothetical protein